MNPRTDPASAWAAAATLQKTIDSAYPRFVPQRSIIHPKPIWPIAYAAWKATTMWPYCTSFQPIAFSSRGASSPRTWRSM